jgi:basic membrane protein A
VNVITRKRGLSGLALVGTAALLLAGCAAAPEETETVPEVDFKGCAVSDEGSWNDKSFNEAAYEGLTQAKDELGIQTADAESQTTEDFEPNLAAMVEQNCDIIFAVGFNLIDAVNAAAEANPDFHYVTIDGYVSNGATNLKPVQYAMNQSSYLAGYLAAAYSTTKVVGTYGGLQIDAVTDFMSGYYYGAKAYEAESGEAVTVLGWDPTAATGDFTDGFGDTEGAKSISAGQIAQDADVIFPVAGGLFSATAEAIDESGKPVVFIGVDKNIAVTSPEYADKVLTSVEKRMTAAVYDIIAELVDGGEFSGEAYVGTLANEGTALSEFGDFEVSDEVKAKLDELKAGIIDGSIDPLS